MSLCLQDFIQYEDYTASARRVHVFFIAQSVIVRRNIGMPQVAQGKWTLGTWTDSFHS